MTTKTINTIGEKTAQNIAGAGLETRGNDYNFCIVSAARRLVDRGELAARYVTQFGSGSTLWELPNGEREILTMPAR